MENQTTVQTTEPIEGVFRREIVTVQGPEGRQSVTIEQATTGPYVLLSTHNETLERIFDLQSSIFAAFNRRDVAELVKALIEWLASAEA